MIPHTSALRPSGQLFLDYWTARHSIGSEEPKPAGSNVPIRRDMIERGSMHEVRCGAGDPDCTDDLQFTNGVSIDTIWLGGSNGFPVSYLNTGSALFFGHFVTAHTGPGGVSWYKGGGFQRRVKRWHHPRQRRRLAMQEQAKQLLTQPSVILG